MSVDNLSSLDFFSSLSLSSLFYFPYLIFNCVSVFMFSIASLIILVFPYMLWLPCHMVTICSRGGSSNINVICCGSLVTWWPYVVGLAEVTSMLWLSLELRSNIVSKNFCLLEKLSFKSWFSGSNSFIVFCKEVVLSWL